MNDLIHVLFHDLGERPTPVERVSYVINAYHLNRWLDYETKQAKDIVQKYT